VLRHNFLVMRSWYLELIKKRKKMK